MDEHDATSLAIVATKLDHLASTVDKIEKSLQTSTTTHVTRSEWELRNQTIDERFASAKADRENIWNELRHMEARKAPWWTILAAIGSAIAVLALVFQWVPQIVNN